MEEEQIKEIVNKISALKAEIGKRIIGQESIIDQLLITLISRGHALLEGVPGLAKTLMVRTLAEATHLKFKRIQFTPDLMPTDIIGTEIIQENPSTGNHEFKFSKGPVFTNILLADEINRTPPKTQSALLEAMQEFEVTYAGETYELDPPFLILATQNPIEQSGTFPLPEAQLDRFLLYIQLDYPDEENEFQILSDTTGTHSVSINEVITGEEIIQAQKLVRQVVISDELIRWVNSLVRSTRLKSTELDFIKEYVQWGAGPRAGQSLILSAKAYALLNGRYSVTPEDIKAIIHPVLRHRVLVNFKAEADGVTSDQVIDQMLAGIKLPEAVW